MHKTIEFIRNNNDSIDINISDINRIIFVGSGDSHIAPHSLLLIILKYINANILILTPLEVFNFSYKLDDLVVLISFSGESKQLIRANKYLNTFKCKTVSITFNSNNTISDGCNYNYKIPVKSNRLTPHATDYMNTLLAITKENILVDEMSIILQNIVKNVFVITNSLQFNNNNHLIIKNIEEGWQPFLETALIQLICLFISNNNNYDVIKKNGINKNFRKYNEVHNLLVR